MTVAAPALGRLELLAVSLDFQAFALLTSEDFISFITSSDSIFKEDGFYISSCLFRHPLLRGLILSALLCC